MTSKGERPSCRAQSSRAGWMRARVCKAAQGLATVVAIATAFAFSARAAAYTTVDSTTALALGGASGGDEIRKIWNLDGTFDLVHIFTTTGEVLHLTTPSDTSAIVNARILLVGGGGGGGADCGGGGGAGGLIYLDGLSLPAGVVPVTVGAGGAEVVKANNRAGNDGSDSVITIDGTTYTANGGGGGGCYNNTAGRAGGSGGGSYSTLGAGNSNQTAPGVGNAGGTASGAVGGGGGGAGSVGGAASSGNGGAGGDGLQYDITGESKWYAAGGGGGGNGGAGGAGGSGIGGRGGKKEDGYYSGVAGEPGTGSGGGGACGGVNESQRGAAGGSGIVVIRYTVLNILEDGSVLYTFAKTNAVNQLILPKAALTRILAVGGGGGGAGPGNATATQGGAGGGGAGGMIDTNNYMLVGGTYSITVGAGGAGGAATDVNPGNMGGNGDDTCIATNGVDVLRAYGGGGGGIRADGNPGGSGGGGSRYSNNATAGPKYGGSASQPDSTWGGYGNKGGDSSAAYYQGGAGGGGAGGPGANVSAANTGAKGGAPAPSNITGTPKWYAAGGGGGSRGHATTASVGGAGGTGDDDIEYGGHGGYGTTSDKTEPTKGKDGTGSGGGGGYYRGAGGAGGSGIVIVRVIRYMPDKPVDTNFTYTGATIAAYAEDSYAEKAYTLEGTYEASAVGNYTFTATLKPGFCWGDGSTGSVKVNWKILPKPIVISRFAQDGWQLTEAAAAPDPVLVADPMPHASEVDYLYSASSNDWTNATTNEKPVTVGTWYVKPQFKSTNFTYDNDNVPVAEFQLWDYTEGKYPDYLGYHADIDAVDTGTNHLVKVVVSEGVPFGFSYDKTREDGSDIRFTAVTNGVVTLLAYTNATWDVTGKSVFWVRVPAGVDGITMNWGVILDAEGNEIEIPDSPDGSEVMGGVVIPAELYTDARAYHTCITVTNYGGTALTDFPMAVQLGGGLPAGFTYATAASDGSDLVFSLADGTLLAFEIEQWDTNGTSLVWVKVPTYQDGTQIWLHWGKKAELSKALPAATTVWSNYAGVWHMGSGTDEMAGTYGTAATKDSTGNNADATVGSASSGVSAVFGSGLNSTSNSGGPILKIPAGVQIDNLTNAAFTASFWAKIDNNASGKTGWPTLFARRSVHGGTGYGVRVVADTINPSAGTNIRIYYGGSGNYVTWNNDTRIAGGTWQRHDVMYKPGRVEWYIDGVFQGAAYSGLTAWTDYGYVSIGGWGEGSDSLVGAVDELRMRSGEINPALIAAETNQWALIASGSETYTSAATVIYTPGADAVGPTVVTPESRFANRWIVEPSFSKSELDQGTDPFSYLSLGAAAYGVPTFAYYTVGGEAVADITAVPAGSYKVRVWVDEGELGTCHWAHLESFEFVFTIVAIQPYTILGTNVVTRVLLGNDDTNPLGPVTNQQSYALSEIDEGLTYWVHQGDYADSTFINLKPGITNLLYSATNVAEICGGTLLWHLEDVLLGSMYINDAASEKSPAVCYLPNSSTASEPSHMLMRNIEGAAIYSPCYTNGIGTIYFDAVNAVVEGAGEYYNIELQICTDTNYLTTAAPPTIPASAWTAVEMTPLLTTDGTTFAQLDATNNLALAATSSGTDRNFYRIYASLKNQMGPVRFRIRRKTTNTTQAGNDDGYNFILIDNVIASHPAMRVDLAPYYGDATYDARRTGEATLGWAGSFDVPLPSVGDELKGRAQATVSGGALGQAADTAARDLVANAQLCYRWRYLEQETVPAEGWSSVSLNPLDNFAATDALTLPEGRRGDVEFFFTARLNAPYYDYVDYSGLGLGLGGFYTENIPVVTNRCGSASILESRGTDWFVRLREGESGFEGLELATLSEDKATTNDVIKMELVGNHTWRGCFQTKTNAADTVICFQIRARNEQTADATGWATNVTYWALSADADEVPVSSILDVGDIDTWRKLPIDATTGHLMFQVDDRTRSITVVHADYQNFNAWNDAKQSWFVGTSTYTNSAASGTAAAKMKFVEDFADWVDMPRTTNDWCVPYLGWTDIQNMGNHAANEDFSADSSGAWTVGPGRWVPQWYNDSRDNMGVALQMAGQGQGFVQLTSESLLPRGIGTLSFNARLAQAIEFEDFTYFDGGVKSRMTNYTFTARTAFDANKCEDFSGQAALSIIAYYRPRVGCYELRIEPQQAAKQNASAPGGVNRSKQLRMSLHRWSVEEATGKLEDEELGSYMSNFKMPIINTIESTSNTNGSGTDSKTKLENPVGYLPLYISVSNAVDGTSCIMAGVGQPDATLAYNDAVDDQSGKNFYTLIYRDSSDRKLTAGTYGVLSTNCKGIFLQPYHYDRPIPFLSNYTENNKPNYYSNSAVTFTGSSTSCRKDIRDDLWVMKYGRMQTYDVHSSERLWGIFATTNTIAQTLTIYSSPEVGKSEPKWTAVTNVAVNGFGTRSGTTAYKIPLYLTEQRLFKLAVDGDRQSVRRDVVIDSLRLDAWRGADWEKLGLLDESPTRYVPDWRTEATGSEGHTNFTFTSGWITNHTVLLSARRTQPGKPAAIKSPLMDGSAGYGRGTGLGMIAYSYRDAQPNVRLLVQIATNGVGTANIATINNLDESTWTTVATNDFSTCTAAELKGGVRSVYLGLHGVKGVMRIVMDPAVVNSVTNEFDASKFGDIYITGVSCTDEPMLDETSWWGWNLRAVGSTEEADPEKRMFLSDLSTSDDDVGMSMALNNSPVYNIDTNAPAAYKEHMPFVQTPTFAKDIVGEVQFRARKYVYTSSDTNETAAVEAFNDQPAFVALYGATSGSEGTDANWKLLKTFAVSNTTYETFSHKTEPNDSYSAFRLSVPGVEGLANYMAGGHALPEDAESAVRVLLDEVLVTEAVRARMAFRNVGAFRGNKNSAVNVAAGRSNIMRDLLYVPNVPSEEEQPLCNEVWGVQCEVYAAQLPDEIDFDRTPRVLLHYFRGKTPWGYDRWKDKPSAKVCELPLASDTNGFYRSSYVTGPDSVLPIDEVPGIAYQYMLEVVYYQKDSSTPLTNQLTSADWTAPAWYRQVDYNAQPNLGAGEHFAAYNILDTVAPGWAWINEVNLFGRYDRSFVNSEGERQFVEIAAPAEADITGWHVNMLEPVSGSEAVITNTIATFGANGLSSTKKNLAGMENNMVFHVIGSGPSNAKLKCWDGSAYTMNQDGTWKFDAFSSTFDSTGEILAINPIGIQLVRASGIVEHEIVTIGTNWWGNSANYAAAYHPTNTVNYLNKRMPGSAFFYAGADEGDEGDSLGVFDARGETASVWTNVHVMTPGKMNANQYIDPNHPTPNGDTVIVYCNLDTSVGHVSQTISGVTTNRNQIYYLDKGSESGLTIRYDTDRWFQLDSVKTGEVAVAYETLPGGLDGRDYYQTTVGVNASNNFTIVAKAKVIDKLVEYGLGDDNRYTDAVVSWLSGGQTRKGPFAGTDEEIRLADFYSLGGDYITNMNLTAMYWLDMDPTCGGLRLYGGMSSAPSEHIMEYENDVWGYMINTNGTAEAVHQYTETFALTNLRMNVKLWITNAVAGGSAWAPYMLRGVTPGTTSLDKGFTLKSWSQQTNVTFKIMGLLANGKTSFTNRRAWVPLRWFVFTGTGAGAATVSASFDENFESKIELVDPYSNQSPGWAAWDSWFRANGGKGSHNSDIFYYWSLDDRTKPIGFETLKKENYYE